MEPKEADRIIAAAWAAVEKAGVAERSQPIAFEIAVELLVEGRPVQERPEIGQEANLGDESDSPELDGVHEDFRKIAKKLEVSAAEVARVFRHGADGIVVVDIGLSRLPKTMTASARDLTLLVAAGRQSTFGENETATSDIVPILEEHNAYDSKNYKSSHLKGEKDNWKVTKDGDAIRVSSDGIRAAAELVIKYSDTGD